jgi:hypothetical protein
MGSSRAGFCGLARELLAFIWSTAVSIGQFRTFSTEPVNEHLVLQLRSFGEAVGQQQLKFPRFFRRPRLIA